MDELRNLQQMASLASGRFNQYDGEDFVLPHVFKEQVKEINSNTITYNKYSAIIETKGSQHGILNIFLPNQWFYIASYFTDFFNELQKYKRYALQVTTKERLKELNGNELTGSELNNVSNLDLDEASKKHLIRFITDYSWWGGAKTIDRGDFYVSPILANANLVNASQSFVADLCAFLANKQELVQAIINKEENNRSAKHSRVLLFPSCLESKEGINGFLDRAIPIVLERDADLYRLDKFANVDGGVYLTIGRHNLGRASDKDARPNDINPNIEWTCGVNGKRYYLNREVNYPNFVTFQETFNEAYKGIFEIVIDTIDYNGAQRKRYSLYAVNSAVASTDIEDSPYRPYLTAIKSKPFLLLAGISGTGKSRIVRELARACWDEGSEEYNAQKPQNFEMIQVKPNWHDSTELIGYVSRVSGEAVYVIGDFLRFVTKAWENLDVPYFLCLDEMNLAPVEQYFAEFLSVIESRKSDGRGHVTTDPILKKSTEDWYRVLTAELTGDNEALRTQFLEEGIALPQNLIVVGTVNMDETTFSFSRKVLDRAMTIEMNEVDLWGGLDYKYERIGKLSGDMLIGKAVEGVDVYADNKEVCDIALEYLKSVNEILDKTPFKVAYRTRNEFLLYVVNNLPYTIGEDGTEYSRENVIATALDEITSMKVLSRIEGDDTKVPNSLLAELKRVIREQLLKITGENDQIESVSLAKLDEMQERLKSGYTSFWS